MQGKAREQAISDACDKLERNFEIVGSTAIEDRLQEGVPEAIKHIKQAGIKLWILTGDKIETAINIGFACNVLDDAQSQVIIDGSKSDVIYKQIKDALILSGESLVKITKINALNTMFKQLIDRAVVVLACRVSPKQKADIVTMVRTIHPSAKTLAIGDGANDVNMITAAHVGIGISGLEGQ